MNDTELQRVLKSVGYYKGALDGDIGPESRKAIVDFLGVNSIPYQQWTNDRRVLAAKQLACKQAGIEVGNVDGLMGPQTRYAFEIWAARSINAGAVAEATTWRDADLANRDEIEKIDLVAPTWPKQANVSTFFGEMGKNQTMLELPYAMRLAWDPAKTVKRISIHEKCADSASRVLWRIADAYSVEKRKELGLDLFGGCLNVRKMRGGTAYSMHSWGIALDFDPERNQLRWGRDRARLAQPDCATFWRLWAEEGWLSLGQARNYDWMHVQAARL